MRDHLDDHVVLRSRHMSGLNNPPPHTTTTTTANTNHALPHLPSLVAPDGTPALATATVLASRQVLRRLHQVSRTPDTTRLFLTEQARTLSRPQAHGLQRALDQLQEGARDRVTSTLHTYKEDLATAPDRLDALGADLDQLVAAVASASRDTDRLLDLIGEMERVLTEATLNATETTVKSSTASPDSSSSSYLSLVNELRRRVVGGGRLLDQLTAVRSALLGGDVVGAAAAAHRLVTVVEAMNQQIANEMADVARRCTGGDSGNGGGVDDEEDNDDNNKNNKNNKGDHVNLHAGLNRDRTRFLPSSSTTTSTSLRVLIGAMLGAWSSIDLGVAGLIAHVKARLVQIWTSPASTSVSSHADAFVALMPFVGGARRTTRIYLRTIERQWSTVTTDAWSPSGLRLVVGGSSVVGTGSDGGGGSDAAYITRSPTFSASISSPSDQFQGTEVEAATALARMAGRLVVEASDVIEMVIARGDAWRGCGGTKGNLLVTRADQTAITTAMSRQLTRFASRMTASLVRTVSVSLLSSSIPTTPNTTGGGTTKDVSSTATTNTTTHTGSATYTTPSTIAPLTHVSAVCQPLYVVWAVLEAQVPSMRYRLLHRVLTDMQPLLLEAARRGVEVLTRHFSRMLAPSRARCAREGGRDPDGGVDAPDGEPWVLVSPPEREDGGNHETQERKRGHLEEEREKGDMSSPRSHTTSITTTSPSLSPSPPATLALEHAAWGRPVSDAPLPALVATLVGQLDDLRASWRATWLLRQIYVLVRTTHAGVDAEGATVVGELVVHLVTEYAEVLVETFLEETEAVRLREWTALECLASHAVPEVVGAGLVKAGGEVVPLETLMEIVEHVGMALELIDDDI